VVTNTTSSDLASQGDDHLRLIKSTIKSTFPNINGAVTLTDEQLNLALYSNGGIASLKGDANTTTATSYVRFAQLGGTQLGLVGFQNGAGDLSLQNSVTNGGVAIVSNGTGIVAVNGVSVNSTSLITSGTFADARISQSSVTQHANAVASAISGGTAIQGNSRNITNKNGTTKTLSTSTASGGSDGDIWYRY
jgi:hypothetical protein